MILQNIVNMLDIAKTVEPKIMEPLGSTECLHPSHF